jgi:hypothetical protein
MSIKSVEVVVETLRTLPDEQQRAACEFIDSLRSRSRGRTRRPVKTRSHAPRGTKGSSRPRRMGDWILQDGLWVYHGALAPGWDDKFGRRLEHERLFKRPRGQLRTERRDA